jgi:hypothetical protein
VHLLAPDLPGSEIFGAAETLKCVLCPVSLIRTSHTDN